MDSLKLYSYLESCSVKELQRTKQHLEQLIKEKLPAERTLVSNLNADDFVDYRDSFISEAENNAITKSLKSYKVFNTNTTSTKSLWLSRTNEPYSWTSRKSGTVFNNKAVPIAEFSDINVMLDKVNAELGSDLNSCLIQYYPDNSSGIRVHDDFEHVMDSNQPIVVISLGATRTVEFFHNFQSTSETPAKSFGVQSNSMYVMKAKCQEYFRHRVPAAKVTTSERFSLSFRRIHSPESAAAISDATISVARPLTAPSKVDAATSPMKSPTAKPALTGTGTSPMKSTSAASPSTSLTSDVQTSPSLDKSITLLFGTSITRWVKPELLTDKHTEFINVSHSGAHIINRSVGQNIPDFGEMVENFVVGNVDKVPRVKQIILSLGTNDIKHYRVDNGRGRRATPGDVGKFYYPILNLVKSLRRHFGTEVSIYFTSVLPMKVMYTYTARNFLNFNRLLQEICSKSKCGYLNWFKYFLDSDGCDYNKDLYADPIH